MSLALTTERPRFCVSCGWAFTATNIYDRQDWQAGASISCLKCGASYQHLEAERLLVVAEEAGGDLRYYHG